MQDNKFSLNLPMLIVHCGVLYTLYTTQDVQCTQ